MKHVCIVLVLRGGRHPLDAIGTLRDEESPVTRDSPGETGRTARAGRVSGHADSEGLGRYEPEE